MRDLRAELPEQQFNTWIRPLQAVEEGQVLKLLAPNRFVVDWLNQHYLGRIEEIVGGSDRATHVVVEVGSKQLENAVPAPARSPAPAASPFVSAKNAVPVISRLNPDFVLIILSRARVISLLMSRGAAGG